MPDLSMGASTSATTPTMSRADIAAHEASSHVRRLPKRVPGEALKAEQIEAAYQEHAEQISQRLAERVAFERRSYELAAGGDR